MDAISPSRRFPRNSIRFDGIYKFECGSGAEPLAFGVIEDNDNYHTRARILVQVTIYRKLYENTDPGPRRIIFSLDETLIE